MYVRAVTLDACLARAWEYAHRILLAFFFREYRLLQAECFFDMHPIYHIRFKSVEATRGLISDRHYFKDRFAVHWRYDETHLEGLW